jgi:hypothetical protein
MAKPMSDQMRMKQRGRRPCAAANSNELALAHRLYEKRTWYEAYQAFLLADQKGQLSAEDLELLATAAYLLGRDDEYLKTLERACSAYEGHPAPSSSALCVLARLSPAHARRDWPRERLARSCSTVAGGDARECAERGYLPQLIADSGVLVDRSCLPGQAGVPC